MTEPRRPRACIIGAGGGIGGALLAACTPLYAPVYAVSRRPLADVPKGVRTSLADLDDETSVAEAARRIGEAGPLDLVIVATGLLHADGVAPEKTFRALDRDAMMRAFAINTVGPALAAKHFLPLLAKTGRPVFAALSARVGSIGDNRLGGWLSYRASKAALNMVIKTLAIELARTNPAAVCIGLHPGTVDTPLSRPFQRQVAAETLFPPERAAAHLLDVIGRVGSADSGRCFAWDGSIVPP